jgi:hypothetical protein
MDWKRGNITSAVGDLKGKGEAPIMWKKPEYRLGRNFAANTPAARRPLAAVMTANRSRIARKRGFEGEATMKFFPLKDTPLLAAGFFIPQSEYREFW